MLCPYCSDAMKKGYIPNRKDNVCWIPEGEKPGWFSIHSPNSVTLAVWELFGCTAEAFYCEPCGKIVLDLPKQEGPEQGLSSSASPYQFK